MYKSLIICLDSLGDYKDLKFYFNLWKTSHPLDLNVARQHDLIVKKHGKTLDQLAAMKRDIAKSYRPKPL
jgi:hypothetical protein